MVKDYIIAALLGAVGCLTGFIDMPIWEMEVCVACFMAGLYIIRTARDEPEEDEAAACQEETFRWWLEHGTIGRRANGTGKHGMDH